MASSTFDSKLPQAYIPRAVTAHRKTGEPVPDKWHTYPEQAAASLWSTPSDLARLIIEVLKSLKNESNLVLSAEMTRQMLIPQIGIGGGGIQYCHKGWYDKVRASGVERRLSQCNHRLPGNRARNCLDDQWRKRQTPWT